MSENNTNTTKHIREAPRVRFSGEAIEISLDEAVYSLRSELKLNNNTHAQIALSKKDGLTVALFLFQAGAILKEHCAAGSVVIQVIEGEIQTHIDGKVHELSSGQLLILEPKIQHDVFARRESVVLVTIALLS